MIAPTNGVMDVAMKTKNELDQRVGERLRSRRLNMGLSQTELGAALQPISWRLPRNRAALLPERCYESRVARCTPASPKPSKVTLMVGHTVMGTTLVFTGEIAESRSHLDQAIALYDPTEHRPLATWFGQDARVSILAYRAMTLWMLAYPEAALADTERMLNDARAISQAGTLMYALIHASRIYLFCRDYATRNATIDECIALAEEKNAVFWKAGAMSLKGVCWSRPAKPQKPFMQ